MAYDTKFKERVIMHLTKSNTQESTAKLFGIGTTTIKEWKRRIAANEPLEPKIRQRQPKKLPPEELRSYVAANPDAYISEIAEHFNCCDEAVRKALIKLKITRKKRQPGIGNAMKDSEPNL